MASRAARLNPGPLAVTNVVMASEFDPLRQYREHLEAWLRARRGRSTPDDLDEDRFILSDEIAAFRRTHPHECLNLVLHVLRDSPTSELIEAVGDELLEDLLNENSAVVHSEVLHQLRNNRSFRQAFACGTYSSVDPAIISEWVNVFRDLGTTKSDERKSLRRRDA